MSRVTTEVLIVGAGPYGLSLAYDLHKRGIRFVVVGHPFSLWLHHMLPNMKLRSDFRASQLFSRDCYLSLSTFLAQSFDKAERTRIIAGRIPLTIFQDYLKWVLARLPFSALQDTVELLQEDNGSFNAHTAGGLSIHARKVVIATGIEKHRHLPPALLGLPSEKVLHSWFVERYASLKARSILVVGGGQSAAETLATLAPNNRVTWVHRSPLIFFSEPINLPKPIFGMALRLSPLFYHLPPVVSRMLGRRFLQATITPDLRTTVTQPSVRHLQADIECLKLRETPKGIDAPALGLHFDEVVACTGYRYRLETLGFLSPALLRNIAAIDGVPVLRKDYSSSQRNLYLVGGMAEPTHGPAQRFMFGCRDATLKVGQALDRSV